MSTYEKLRLLTYPVRRQVAHALAPNAVSFSAWAEDIQAIAWLHTLGVKDWSAVRYLDIGACHPIQLSNTYALYRRGARGALVEPNPALAEALQNKRPHDAVICAGIAFDNRRSAKLHRFTNPVFNSFAEPSSPHTSYIDSVSVPLIPLNDILQEHFPDRAPEFLSIDAEGVDFQILSSIDFNRHKPLVICVETSTGWDEYDKLLSPYGYQYVCRTPDNAMFVRFA